MSHEFEPEVIEALARLRNYAKHSLVAGPVCEAIDTLDNAGVFARLDEQTDYASAEEVLAESARMSLEGRFPNATDPAEWGDTTRADMARRQIAQGRLDDPGYRAN